MHSNCSKLMQSFQDLTLKISRVSCCWENRTALNRTPKIIIYDKVFHHTKLYYFILGLIIFPTNVPKFNNFHPLNCNRRMKMLKWKFKPSHRWAVGWKFSMFRIFAQFWSSQKLLYSSFASFKARHGNERVIRRPPSKVSMEAGMASTLRQS